MGRYRPKPKFETAEEMQEKIDVYFRECAGELLTDDAGNPILINDAPFYVGKRPPTMTGLAMALGFSSRQSISNYRKKPAFESVLTVARTRVEMYAEQRLYDRDGVNGAKFNLIQNFGWSAEKAQRKNEAGRIVRIIDKSAGTT